MMVTFNEGDFVHQATDGGAIKLVVGVDRRAHGDLRQMDRFTLQGVDGATIANIGAYELTPATDEDVEAALKNGAK